MHRGHDEHHRHDKGEPQEAAEVLRRLLAMLEHWIDHGDSHTLSYREWASRASEAGEPEIAREIHLAVEGSESVKDHLKRAKAVLAAKLILKR